MPIDTFNECVGLARPGVLEAQHLYSVVENEQRWIPYGDRKRTWEREPFLIGIGSQRVPYWDRKRERPRYYKDSCWLPIPIRIHRFWASRFLFQ